MACGLPVIVSNTTGASSIVKDGETGFVVDPGDWKAIVDRLSILAKDRDKIESMGSAAREAVSELTLERFRQRYVPELIALASGRRS
jgi:glycosyltransferase involved in cell wall biosynthesis